MVAVVAATLLGAALTALLLGGRLWATPQGAEGSDGTAAGLRIPSASPTTSLAPPSAGSTGSTGSTGSPGPAVAVATATPAAPSAGSATPSGPTRVSVPRLGVDMTVEAQGVDERGQMGLPPNPAVAGWYRFGAAPTDPAGAVVVAAHIDSKTFGVGPFARLGTARAGDEVDLYVGGTKVTYRVSQVARVDKVALDADGLFSLTGPARLHLVTCTGDYAPGSGYTQNLVVVADRVGA